MLRKSDAEDNERPRGEALNGNVVKTFYFINRVFTLRIRYMPLTLALLISYTASAASYYNS